MVIICRADQPLLVEQQVLPLALLLLGVRLAGAVGLNAVLMLLVRIHWRVVGVLGEANEGGGIFLATRVKDYSTCTRDTLVTHFYLLLLKSLFIKSLT